jgi:hypothetical protein
MAIEPDTKNWTWVLERPCPECGFDPAVIVYRDIPRLVAENASAWPAALDVADPRRRPDDSTWSPLEYAAHVRDVFIKFDERVNAMLSQDNPAFENWDQDATAVAERYNEQDPAAVTDQLTAAATQVAQTFASVPDDALTRRGNRSDGSEFTIESLALYFIHDPVHHLHDVTGIRFHQSAP